MQIGWRGISRTQHHEVILWTFRSSTPNISTVRTLGPEKNEGSFWINQNNWLTKCVVGTLKSINQFYACSRESLLLYGKRALLELKECKPAPYP